MRKLSNELQILMGFFGDQHHGLFCPGVRKGQLVWASNHSTVYRPSGKQKHFAHEVIHFLLISSCLLSEVVS